MTSGLEGHRSELRIAQTLSVSTTKRVAGEGDAAHGPFPSRLIPRAARISHDNGNVAQVGGMPHGRFEANLDGHSGNQIRAHATVAQHDVERSALERGHGDLVDDRLPGARLEFLGELEAGRAMRDQRAGLGCAVLALPDLGLA
jgi:hypothetical protein